MKTSSTSPRPYLAVLVLAAALSGQVVIPGGPQPINPRLALLNQHLATFINISFPGQLGATTTLHAVVNSSSNVNALAALIADNWFCIDVGSAGFAHISGAGQAQFIAVELLPRLVPGAVVARVTWTYQGQSAVAYALVGVGATVGDTYNIQEGVTSWYKTLIAPGGGGSPLSCPSSVHKEFKNGFGALAATYDANVDCFNRNCIGTASCWEAGLGCSCHADKRVRCSNGTCLLDYAFAGTCGFPSVSLSTEPFEFEVSGFGWTYFKEEGTLCKECDCISVTSSGPIGSGSGQSFQSNQGSAYLGLNNAVGTSVIGMNGCTNVPVALHIDSVLVGNGWELGTVLAPPLAAQGGGIVTPGGQVINLDVLHPSLALLNGGTLPPFPGHTTLSLVFPNPIVLSAQMLILDPGRLDGFSLSAANTLQVLDCGN